ncbi:MAG TPA: WD40 repeat domain-containing protein, partial [Pirellulaceae bacterium]|nr:WD40 repeat domain-containing protein [Pirellulaceae bacterium]
RRLVASPDGTRFATAGDEAVVRVFETSTGREVERIATTAPVGAGLAPADQGVVAWSTNDKQAKVYRVGAEQMIVADAQKLHAAVFGADGEQIVTSGEDRVVKLWGADGKLVRQFAGAAAPLRNLALRGDGQLIVAGGDPAVQQTIVYAWRTATGEALPPLTAPSPIVALSLGGLNRVAVATADQHVRVYSQDDNRLLQDFTLPAAVSSVAFAADGKQLVASTADQSSYVLKSGVERLIAGAPGSVFTGVVFSPDGESFFTSGTDRLAKQWSLTDGRLMRTFSGSSFPLTAVAVSRDGRTVATAAGDNIMRLWSVPASMPAAQTDAKPEAKPEAKPAPPPAGQPAAQPAAPPQDVPPRATIALPSVVRGLVLNADGTRLATGGDENVVHWWDTTNGKQLERLTGHTGAVLGVVLLADGSLLSASADTTVRRATPSVEAVVVAHETATTDVEFSPDGKTLFTCGADKLVRQWSTDGLGKLREFAGAAGLLKSLAVSADGGRVAAVGDDAHVRLWKVDEGRPLAARQLPAALHSVLLTKDGGRAIVGGADSMVRNISITPDGEALKLDVATELRGHTAAVTRLALGADDRTVYSSGVDQTVREWVAASGSARREWRLHEAPVYGVAFSADSLRLVSGGGDGRAIVVHTRDEAVAPITVGEHQGAINSVAFHAGGKQFATTGDDGAVRLWDDAGKLVKKLSVGLTGRQQALSYSPDGNHLVVGGSSKLLFAVNRDSAQIVRTLEGHNDSLYRVAHNATGTRWATIDYSGHLFIWDAAAGGLLFHQQLPVATAHSLAWNPDGTEIVVATSDPRVLRVIVPPPAR